MKIPADVVEQINRAYKRMSTEARYRPSLSDSDLAVMPEAELVLEDEQRRYAERWWREEEDLRFVIGCCDTRTREATIYAVEAARLMCAGGMNNAHALALLKMAVRELEENR